MWNFPSQFDVIVVGAGHAGCEAAHAAAKMGASTLLLTMNLDTIAKMSCNPAVGGIGKGHMVREIDALGGLMAKVTDKTGIQFRMLNATKGPAVWAPRAQSDKVAYQFEMKHRLECTPNLHIMQGTIETLLVEEGKVKGVATKEGIAYLAPTVVLSSGTFMQGLIHVGNVQYSGGRAGDLPSVGLSKSLQDLGFRLGRLKTGTPPRVNAKSLDFSSLEEQKGDDGIYFSYDRVPHALPQVSCYITYTSLETKKIVQEHLHRSALYSGRIQGRGPRYCPSFEDKVVRFADKDRHQIFLEPEGVSTEEVYVNGISTSLPFDVQLMMIHSIPGLERAQIMRPAYAIEYDYILSGQIEPSLETRLIEGLFFAGQINGTTGYEEAASQGLLAGINAAAKVLKKPPLILKRSEAYIGVMMDDLATQELEEPYRMFTSRAEYRLLLRQDNADLRLRELGYRYGLVDEKTHTAFRKKTDTIHHEIKRLKTTYKNIGDKGQSLAKILSRPDFTYQDLLKEHTSVQDHGPDINLQIELNLKYEGYIQRQEKEVQKLLTIEEIPIPKSFDYHKVTGLRYEALEKLKRYLPANLGQASRINGVNPADISILMVHLKK